MNEAVVDEDEEDGKTGIGDNESITQSHVNAISLDP